MHCIKLGGQSLMAKGFDRQVAEIQILIGVLNRYTALDKYCAIETFTRDLEELLTSFPACFARGSRIGKYFSKTLGSAHTD